jgi:hypothetical protein
VGLGHPRGDVDKEVPPTMSIAPRKPMLKVAANLDSVVPFRGLHEQLRQHSKEGTIPRCRRCPIRQAESRVFPRSRRRSMGSAMITPQGGNDTRKCRRRQLHAGLSPRHIHQPQDPPERGNLEPPLATPLTRREPIQC